MLGSSEITISLQLGGSNLVLYRKSIDTFSTVIEYFTKYASSMKVALNHVKYMAIEFKLSLVDEITKVPFIFRCLSYSSDMHKENDSYIN